MLGFSRGPIDGPVTRGLTARGITAKPPRLCSGGSTPALDAKPMAARGTRSARRRGSAAPIRAGDGKGLDADARTGCGFRVDCRLVHAPPSNAHPASPGNARREMTLLSGSDRLTASHRRVLHPHTDFRESLYVGGLGSSDWPTGAFQQRVRGTQRVALENVHVYCVWISMHKWLAAGVGGPASRPFFFFRASVRRHRRNLMSGVARSTGQSPSPPIGKSFGPPVPRLRGGRSPEEAARDGGKGDREGSEASRALGSRQATGEGSQRTIVAECSLASCQSGEWDGILSSRGNRFGSLVQRHARWRSR